MARSPWISENWTISPSIIHRLRDRAKVLHGQTSYTTFLPHSSHPLHHSPSTLSAISHLSVPLWESVGTLECNLQTPETDHQWNTCPSFREVLFPNRASMGQPLTIYRYNGEDSNLFLETSSIEVDVSALLHRHHESAAFLFHIQVSSIFAPCKVARSRDKIKTLHIMIGICNSVSSGQIPYAVQSVIDCRLFSVWSNAQEDSTKQTKTNHKSLDKT